MTHHHQRNRPWLWALAVGGVLLLGRPTLAQVPLPSPLVPLAKFSITGKASGSETNQTSSYATASGQRRQSAALVGDDHAGGLRPVKTP
jgi:hypothetical protein